jgi:hypothetical protein
VTYALKYQHTRRGGTSWKTIDCSLHDWSVMLRYSRAQTRYPAMWLMQVPEPHAMPVMGWEW